MVSRAPIVYANIFTGVSKVRYNKRIRGRQWGRPRSHASGFRVAHPSKEERVPMQAHEIMTPDVITITPNASLQDAARKLSDYNISGMPVVDRDNQVIGMVTEADIITKRGSTVEEIMTRR